MSEDANEMNGCPPKGSKFWVPRWMTMTDAFFPPDQLSAFGMAGASLQNLPVKGILNVRRENLALVSPISGFQGKWMAVERQGRFPQPLYHGAPDHLRAAMSFSKP
jgi:hypothetical protein